MFPFCCSFLGVVFSFVFQVAHFCVIYHAWFRVSIAHNGFCSLAITSWHDATLTQEFPGLQLPWVLFQSRQLHWTGVQGRRDAVIPWSLESPQHHFLAAQQARLCSRSWSFSPEWVPEDEICVVTQISASQSIVSLNLVKGCCAIFPVPPRFATPQPDGHFPGPEGWPWPCTVGMLLMLQTCSQASSAWGQHPTGCQGWRHLPRTLSVQATQGLIICSFLCAWWALPVPGRTVTHPQRWWDVIPWMQ